MVAPMRIRYIRADSLQVQLEPNFLVSCAEILARQRWEAISGISLITRVSQSLHVNILLTAPAPSPLLEIRLATVW